MSLEQIIQTLIDTQKEGDYWDFKIKHHYKAGDLIKDVICLANTVRHSGDRYIIFGVDNKTFNIEGVSSENRRTQADIVDTLGKAGFAGNLYPDVFLKKITLDGDPLDILIIKDIPEKPYYLQKEYNKKRVKLNPGTIYTRIRDANTPNDQVASAADIEKMWRERFGLDKTPFERLQKYLLDFENWVEIEETNWYYEPFPEFTISKAGEAEEIEIGESWVRAALNPRSFYFPLVCKYHQTSLWKGNVIYYDEMRSLIPKPDIRMIDGLKNDFYHFYSFSMDDFKFLLLQFLTKEHKSFFYDHKQPFESRGIGAPLIVFKSGDESKHFLDYVSSHLDEIQATNYEDIIDTFPVEENRSKKDIEVLKLCSRLKSLYEAWRT